MLKSKWAHHCPHRGIKSMGIFSLSALSTCTGHSTILLSRRETSDGEGLFFFFHLVTWICTLFISQIASKMEKQLTAPCWECNSSQHFVKYSGFIIWMWMIPQTLACQHKGHRRVTRSSRPSRQVCISTRLTR